VCERERERKEGRKREREWGKEQRHREEKGTLRE